MGGGGGGVGSLFMVLFHLVLAQDINWDIVLSPAPVVIFIYLFFYPTYFYFFNVHIN